MNLGLFYRGIVVGNKDPLGLGRIQVRVPEIHGIPGETTYFYNDKDLPWAVVLMSGVEANSGVLVSFPVGSLVMVGFEGGSDNRPFVLGNIPYIEDNKAVPGIKKQGIMNVQVDKEHYISIGKKVEVSWGNNTVQIDDNSVVVNGIEVPYVWIGLGV